MENSNDEDKFKQKSNKKIAIDNAQPCCSKSLPSNTVQLEDDEAKNGKTESTRTATVKTSHSVLVNPCQRGNKLLKYISNVPWEFEEDIVPDYVMGRTTCALYLSLSYHNLKPDYINERIKKLGKLYNLRVLLVVLDMKNPHHCLKHLTRVCLLTDLTLMLAWNDEEAGKIIETYKIFENKPPEMIMEKSNSDPHIKVMNALTAIRSVNKTDALTLMSNYGCLEKLTKSSPLDISQCCGIGYNKATKIHKLLHTPFLRSDKNTETKKTTSDITKFLKKDSKN